jgi:predicted DNA-binding transcriptional regulator AlpA
MPRAKSKEQLRRTNRDALLQGTATMPPRGSLEAIVSGLFLEPEVMIRCRLSRSQIWKLEQADRFPKRKKYGFRRIAWPATEIQEWIAIGADGWLALHGSSAAA